MKTSTHTFRWLHLLAPAPVLLVAFLPSVASAQRPVEVRHPIPDSLLSDTTDTPVHGLHFRALESALPDRLAELARFPEDSAIGRLEGDAALTFGVIVDAALLPGPRVSGPVDPPSASRPSVALLDQSEGIVRTFGPHGTPGSTFGGFGEGPGELRRPVAVAVDHDTVMILDAALKVERYGRTGTGWEPTGRLGLPVDAQDLCPTDDGLLVVGMRIADEREPGGSAGGRAVHLVSRDGEIAASFSRPYRYGGIGPVYSLTRGRLACDRDRGLVWVAYATLREVHALDLDGSLRWIVRLADEAYPDVIERPGGAFGEDPAAERMDLITHVTLLEGSLLAVQVASRSFQERAPGARRSVSTTYRTYFIDGDTGAGVGAFQGGHQVIGGGEGRAVLYREEPFPQFAVVALEAG